MQRSESSVISMASVVEIIKFEIHCALLKKFEDLEAVIKVLKSEIDELKKQLNDIQFQMCLFEYDINEEKLPNDTDFELNDIDFAELEQYLS